MPSVKEIGLYVHWPFCESKCPYCDFNSHVKTQDINEKDWYDAYIKQIQYFASIIDLKNYCFQSIFFGGGTPSLMPPFIAKGIISYLKENFVCADNIEITLESNPSSVDLEKLDEFKLSGVNRLSLGVQSFNNENLKWLGRKHDSNAAINALNIIKKTFDNYSFDLIYGLGIQNAESWKEELLQGLSFAKNHISIYQLTIEENTTFYSLKHQGKLKLLDQQESEDMYFMTCDLLTNVDFDRYEISNFCRNNAKSVHNMLYWRSQDFIGVGPGASSRCFIKDKRFDIASIKNPYKWFENVSNSIKGEECGINVFNFITIEDCIKEIFLMGLRISDGIDLQDIKERFNVDLILYNDKISKTIEKMIHEKLLVLNNNFLSTTKRGFDVVDSIITSLI